MSFNSVHFFVLLLVVFLVYHRLPQKNAWVWLLLASSYFYLSYIPSYFLLILALVSIDYSMARLMEKSATNLRFLYFSVSITSNILILIFFKYFNFIETNLTQVLVKFFSLTYEPLNLNLILPLGLSFLVFQNISYITEVYKGRHKAERHFGIYTLYALFFPKIMSGPIERPSGLLDQLRLPKIFDYGDTVLGARLILWGLFKKIAVANHLAIFVNTVFNHLHQETGPILLAAVLAFAIQLYCDFSGYIDIARGSAKILGINLVSNFNNPYGAVSISDFWRRWHISLSSWFRDYFFTPTTFILRRYKKVGLYLSTMLTFTILGLWHGPAWTYITMGALHGLYIILGDLTKKPRKYLVHLIKLDLQPKLHRIIQITMTFVLVCIGWVIFRSSSMADATFIMTHLISGWGEFVQNGFRVGASFQLIGITKASFLLAITAGIIAIFIEQFLATNQSIERKIDALPKTARWFLYYALVAWILFFGYFDAQPFIYFKF